MPYRYHKALVEMREAKRKRGRPFDPNAIRRTGVDWYTKLSAEVSELAEARCQKVGMSRMAWLRFLIERELGLGGAKTSDRNTKTSVARGSSRSSTRATAKRGTRGNLVELDEYRPTTAAEIEDRQLWLSLADCGDTLHDKLVELGSGQTPWQVAVGAEDTPVSAVTGSILGKHLTANYQIRTGDLRFTKQEDSARGKSRVGK